MLQVRKGGQGKKLPYKTIVKRVPEPLAYDIDRLIESYCKYKIGEAEFEEVVIVYQKEFIEWIRRILKWRKTPKQSMIDLTTFTFGVDSAKELEAKRK